MVGTSPRLFAQTAQFHSAESTIAAGVFRNLHNVTVDANGNVYAADQGGSGAIYKFAPGSNGYTQSTVASGGFSSGGYMGGGLYSLAVDASGNVYAADQGAPTVVNGNGNARNGAIYKYTPNGSGGYTQSTVVASGHGVFFQLAAVAVDASGNVYAADQGANSGYTGAIYEFTPNGSGGYTQSTVASGGFGDEGLIGVAVDAGGNVYAADSVQDSYAGAIYKFTPGGSGSYTQSTVASGVFSSDKLWAVAVGASGNVYAADQGADSNTGAIYEFTPNGSNYTQSTIALGVFSYGSGMSGGLYGVAVDGKGNVYAADQGADSNKGAIDEFQTGSVNFGTSPVKTATSAIPLTFTFTNTTAAAIGTPVVLTQGACANTNTECINPTSNRLDFADAGTGTCDTNGSSHTYSAGNTCTVNVTFTPQYAGPRNGAVELTNSSGAAIVTANVYGMGAGPQVVFNSPVTSGALGGGFNAPTGVAVDGSGNVYVADSTGSMAGPPNGAVYEIPAGCTSTAHSNGTCTVTALGGGFSEPYGVAVDGSGNVYVVDRGGDLYEMPAGCTSIAYSNHTCTVTALGGGTYLYPEGVAVDAGGNVYFTDYTGNVGHVYEMPAGCTSSTCVTTLGGGFHQTVGVAVDGSGNVYVADDGGKVYEMPADCTSTAYSNHTCAVTALGGGFSWPAGVAVDAGGDVYVADQTNNVVYEMPPGCTSTAYSSGTCAVTTLGSGFSAPYGVALDGNGNVYVADANVSNPAVYELPLATPPSLSFGSIEEGSTSSEQTVTVANIGNMPLTFTTPSQGGSNPSYPLGFSENSSDQNLCSSTANPLAAGASCDVSLSFEPTSAGSYSGSELMLTNNTLNTLTGGVGSAQQSIGLSGTGIVEVPGAPTIGTASAGNAQATVNFTAPASDGGAAITGYTATSNPGGITGTCSASPCTVTGLTNRTAYTFTVTATNSVGTGQASNASNIVTPVPVSTTTLSVTANGSAVTTIAIGTVVTLTATVQSGTTAVTPGQVNFCDASPCTGIHLLETAQLTSSGTAALKLKPGIGSHSYQAVFVGTSSYGTSTSSAASLSVTGSYATTTAIAQSGSAGNYTLTATVTGLVNTHSAPPAPTGTVSFLDTANSNTVLGTASLGAGTLSQGFAGQATYTTGSTPTSVAVGDFNGDGIPDLAVANYGSSTVGIFLGNGDGTFQSQVTYSTGSTSQPTSVAVGDFNGDGKPDLAVTSGTTNIVSIFLGNGDGTFPAQANYTYTTGSSGSTASSIAVGDFNGDGIPDLAVANGGGGTVSIFLGNGDGSFQSQVTYSTHYQYPRSVAVGDFNGDGKLDLAVAIPPPGVVIILLGNGDGTFPAWSANYTFSTGAYPVSVAVGDFNGDGIPDLATANYNGSTASVLMGNGDGTFKTQVPYSTGSDPVSVAVGDFNGDGSPDLALANAGGGSVSVLLNSGGGTGTFQAQTTYATGSTPNSVAVGDFNGDGIPDLAVANNTGSTASVLLGQWTETATASASGISPVGPSGSHAVEASYSGDSSFTGSTSLTTSLTAQPETTTLTLGANPSSSTYGQQVALTATLSPYTAQGYSTDGETVTFSSNGISLGTGTLSGGVATLNLTSLPAGADSLTATYAGDSNFDSSSTTTPVSFDVSKATPTISISNLPASGIYGGNFTPTFSYTGDGTTAVSSNSTSICTVTSGVVHYLGVGTCSLTASATAGTNYSSVTGTAETFNVGQAAQTITFSNPGTQNFGTSPTLTATSSSGLTVTFTSSTTAVCTITSNGMLTGITAGICTINADQAGNTDYAAASTVTQSFTVATVVPGAPTIGTATAGDAQVMVTFTAPAFGGGSAITSYAATSNPGGLTGTCATSPCIVTGLTNGTAYTFTVTATNSAGTGQASFSSGPPVTPQGTQTITFNNPGAQYFGTAPILAATASSALPVTFTSSTVSVCTITSNGVLTTITAGTCTINANQAGNGAYLSAPAVSQSFNIAAVVPGAPTIGTATASVAPGGDQQVTVSFTAPTFDGGAAVTVYTATASPGSSTGTCSSSPCTLTGLKAGTTYIFTVTASNSAGPGAPSASTSVTTPTPNLVVTTATDDAGAASNCTAQSSTTTGTDISCSLRDALLYAANAGAANVYFDSTNDFLSSNSTSQNTITLTSGTLTIPKNTTINGATTGSGATLTNLVTVSGNQASTVFTVNSGVTGAAIANLTIANGKGGNGGGIYNNRGTLTVSGSTFSSNSSSGAYGGGIFNNIGTLTVSGSTFSGNTATARGGGIYNNSGTLTVTGSTFYNNRATNAGGGGIGNSGTLTVTGSTFSSNSTNGAGGGIWIPSGTLKLTNSIVAGNSAGSGYADMDIAGTYTNDGGNQSGTNSSGTSQIAITLAPLGNYGGPTQTMIPLPGSPAICAGTATPSGGLTLPASDQRGDARTTTYGSTTCVDAGAVQTNYSIAFAQQPSNVVQGAIMSPAPTVQLDESGAPFMGSAVTIPLTLTGSGTLSGGSVATSTSTGIATYSALSVSAAGSGDTLTANLTLNGTTALTAASNAINVPGVTQLTFSTSPAATVTAGGNAGAAITVNEEDVNSSLVTNAADTITLTVSGPNSYSQTYTSTASGGIATFNLSSAVLAAAGSYSYSATSGSITEAVASESVNAASASTISVVSGSGQSAVIGAVFTTALKVKVLDSYGNPVSGATVTFSGPVSGAGASLSSTTATTASDGTASVTATANGTASSTAYAVSASVSGVSSPASFMLTNAQQSTTLTVTPSATAVVYGQPVTVNAAISPANILTSAPTGSVTFYDGGTALTPNATVTSAAGSYTVNVPAAGGHTYAAQYLGDTNFSASAQTSAASATVVSKASSTLSGPLSPVSVTYGAGGNISITVAGQYSGTGISQPSGSVTYTIGSGTVQTAAISNGVATLVVPTSQSAGTYSVSVSYGGDGNYDAASNISVSLTVAKATATVTLGSLTATYDGNAHAATVTTNPGGLTVNLTYNGSSTAATAAGSYTVTATINDTNYTGSASGTLTINPATPSISWTAPAAIRYGAALSATQLNASSTVAGSYSYTPASGTVLTAGAHTLSVTFTPTDTINYTTATQTEQLTVNRATPTISWTAPAAISYGTALSATQLNASSTVAGSYSYTPASGTVLTAGAHTLSVTFTPTDTTDYTTATQTVTLTVNQATPTISWTAPAAITYGTALSTTQLNASSTVAGSFAYTPATGTVLTAGAHTLSVTFTPTDTTDYTTATATVNLTVNQATPTISWATPAAIIYGTALSATQLNASSTVAGSFAYTPAAGAVLTAGAHTLSVTFTPTDTTDYTTATQTVPLTVNQATPSISWTAPAAINYGTALSATQLNATASFGGNSVQGAYSYTPASGATPTAGTHTLSVTFTPTDTTDYTTATQTVQLAVNQATPTISWTAPAAISYGTALSGTQLNASASFGGNSVAGTYTYSPASGTVLTAGAHTLSVTFTPTDTTNYTTATQTLSLKVNQATPTMNWTAPAAITYGTALSAAQLDAAASFGGNSLAGTYTYTPASGTVLAAGTQSLSVAFTPTDTTNYTAATQTVSLAVNKATVSLSGPAVTLIYGNAGSASITVTGQNSAAIPSGNVSYSINGGALQTATLVNGTAALVIPGTLDAGSYSIPVSFIGDTNYQAGTGTIPLTVHPQATSEEVLTWLPSSPVYDASVQFQSVFTPAAANLPATAFNFLIDHGTPNSVVVPAAGYSGGAVTASYWRLTAGPHTVALQFIGTTDYSASTSGPITIQIGQATPSISWTPAVTIGYGNTLSGLLNPASTYASNSVPGSFSYSAQASGGIAVPVTAATTLPVGSYTLTATFTPTDTNDFKSASANTTLAVTDAALTVTANNATKVYGTANPSFTGSVTGSVNGDSFAESFTTTASAGSNAGTYAIIPSVTGMNVADYSVTVQNGTLTVAKAGSALALASSTANANLNASVTFTAAVTSATTGVPTGQVQFLDGSTVLGTATLNTAGIATYTTSSLATGAHTINAIYVGNGNFNSSTISLAQQVTAPDYSLTANPSSLTLKAGQTGKVTFTFTPVGGFSGTVNFSCTGLPANASCNFAPPALTADGSNTVETSLLTITTLGPNLGTVSRNSMGRAPGDPVLAGIFWLPGLLLGSFLLWERKKLSVRSKQWLSMLVLVAAISGMIGCGYTTPPTNAGSNVVSVTATATGNGSASHTATFTLTITQ